MTSLAQDASRAALHHLDVSGMEETQEQKLLRAACEKAGSARQLARRIGIPEHDATTRCATLKRKGLLEEVGEEKNEGSGRRAVVLGPTCLTAPFLEGKAEAPLRPSRTKLLEAVAAAARRHVEHPGRLTSLAELQAALEALEAK